MKMNGKRLFFPQPRLRIFPNAHLLQSQVDTRVTHFRWQPMCALRVQACGHLSEFKGTHLVKNVTHSNTNSNSSACKKNPPLLEVFPFFCFLTYTFLTDRNQLCTSERCSFTQGNQSWVNRPFKVQPQILNWIWTLTQLLQNIHLVVYTPLLLPRIMPTLWCCHLHASQWGWRVCDHVQSLVSAKNSAFSDAQKNQLWSHKTKNP